MFIHLWFKIDVGVGFMLLFARTTLCKPEVTLEKKCWWVVSWSPAQPITRHGKGIRKELLFRLLQWVQTIWVAQDPFRVLRVAMFHVIDQFLPFWWEKPCKQLALHFCPYASHCFASYWNLSSIRCNQKKKKHYQKGITIRFSWLVLSLFPWSARSFATLMVPFRVPAAEDACSVCVEVMGRSPSGFLDTEWCSYLGPDCSDMPSGRLFAVLQKPRHQSRLEQGGEAVGTGFCWERVWVFWGHDSGPN